MTAIVIGMVLIVVVALLVLVVFSQEEDDAWTTNHPGRTDPDEAHIDDLFHQTRPGPGRPDRRTGAD